LRKIIVFVLFVLFSITLFPQTVYVTKTGSKYHTSNCSSLRKSNIEMNLKDALDKGYTPCSLCMQSQSDSASQKQNEAFLFNSNATNENVKKEKASITSGRCQALTKKGNRCKRNAKTGSKYCWQHGG
jgi:hypothetical protein